MSIVMLVINWVVGLLLLALLLRVILRWYAVSLDNAWMLGLLTVTEPVIKPFYRVVKPSGAYVQMPTGSGYLDIAALAAAMGVAVLHYLARRGLALFRNPPLWLLYPQADLGLWLTRVLGFLVELYILCILARIALEWLRLTSAKPVLRFLWDLTEPLLAFIRRRLPTWGGFDFSPVVAVLVLNLGHILVSILLQSIF